MEAIVSNLESPLESSIFCDFHHKDVVLDDLSVSAEQVALWTERGYTADYIVVVLSNDGAPLLSALTVELPENYALGSWSLISSLPSYHDSLVLSKSKSERVVVVDTTYSATPLNLSNLSELEDLH